MAQYSGIYTLSQASQAIKDNNWTGLPPQNVEFLCVAGGGGGGGDTGANGTGGGGAGGLLASFSGITTGSAITITVGGGGSGGASGHNPGSQALILFLETLQHLVAVAVEVRHLQVPQDYLAALVVVGAVMAFSRVEQEQADKEMLVELLLLIMLAVAVAVQAQKG